MLNVALIIPVEKMSNYSAIKIACAHIPIGNWVREIHISFHHDLLTMMSRMVPTDRIDERAMPYKPIFTNMAAQVKSLVV